MNRDRAPRGRSGRVARWLVLLAALAAVGAALLVGWIRASLPTDDGTATVPGLRAAVTVGRDTLGVPRIEGADDDDVARALGFVHAQERLFQMDLYRRAPAGELAALLGEAALPSDLAMRPLRYRARARALLGALPEAHRQRLSAYAEGVNAGIADLGARPAEYLLLRREVEPWRAEDSLLCAYLFFERLSENARFERQVHVMRETLPRQLCDFLLPDTTRLDAPLIHDGGDPAGGYAPLPIPGPDVIDLKNGVAAAAPERDVVRARGEPAAGSNNFAVAGSRTATGRAILANDPHLRIDVPNVWFRAELVTAGRRVAGVTIPGLPGVLIGATDDLAWGFTNGPGDHEDLVVLEEDQKGGDLYRVPGGVERYVETIETIEVAGGDPVRLTVRSTRFGPVVGEDFRGRPLALRSTALSPDTFNLALVDLPDARDLEAALDVLGRWYGPSQNALLAASDGRIAWILTGYLPRRVGFDGLAPVMSTDPVARWDGCIPAAARPRIVDPARGFLYTANGRTLDLPRSRQVTRAWESPARARRIRDLLQDASGFTEEDLAAIQLDTRCLLLDPYRDLVVEVARDDARLARLAAIARSWSGRADANDRAHALIAEFRFALLEDVLTPLLAPCALADETFVYAWPLMDEPLQRILEERPAHLLPRRFSDWDDLARAALVRAAARLEEKAGRVDPQWGAVHRANFRHPLGRRGGILGRLLNLPRDPLPGDVTSVRAQTPAHGASLRLVVSPSGFDDALVQMPGGQSGHPWSRHYADHHASWLSGDPLPLRVEPLRILTLEPNRDGN